MGTTVMVMPICSGVLSSFEDHPEQLRTFGKALVLGIAYAASVGGMGSLIGTGTNGVLVINAENYNIPLSFGSWFVFAAPFSFMLLLVIWLALILFHKVPRGQLDPEHPARRALEEDLGPLSQAEMVVSVIFLLAVLTWMTKDFVLDAVGVDEGVCDDGTVAVIITILLFCIGARYKDGTKAKLLDWATLAKTPWHLLFLLGGGFALASGYGKTGLSQWIGSNLSGLAALPPFLLVLLVVLMMTFLTEVTSNTATSTYHRRCYWFLQRLRRVARSCFRWPHLPMPS